MTAVAVAHSAMIFVILMSPMRGQMMNYQLTLTPLLERAAKLFSSREIASRTPDGMHRYTYRDMYQRVHRLAHALQRVGLQPGDRVGTLCWNSFRHLELYFAVPCSGMVLHTLNLRLPPDQLAYIINHAGNRVIFADQSLVNLLELFDSPSDSLRRKGDRPARFRTRRLRRTAYSNPPISLSPGRNLMNLPRVQPATLRERRGIRKACSTPIVRWCCTVMDCACRIPSVSASVIRCCRSSPCFMPMGGACRGLRSWREQKLVFSGRQLQPADVACLIENERPTFAPTQARADHLDDTVQLPGESSAARYFKSPRGWQWEGRRCPVSSSRRTPGNMASLSGCYGA